MLGGLLVGRLFTVQIHEGASLAANAGEEQRGTFPLGARRGEIADRFGTVFAATLPSSAIYVRPAQVRNPAAEARALAPVLHADSGELALELERAMLGKEKYLYLQRNVPDSVAKKVVALDLKGVGAEEEPMGRRVAPQSTIGSTLVGFTGVDDQGLAGIEFQFDKELSGHPGSVIEETDSAGRPIPFGHRVVQPAQPGATIVLTIDRTLQFAAEEILRSTARRYDAAGGSIVVMRAQTGEILALANWPNFDPNRYWATPSGQRKNQAVTDPYEPGSTFKLITATAALDSGKVTLDDTFEALDELRVGGRIIHNADDGLMASGRPRETLDDIVTFSHNVGAAQVALRVGKDDMFKYIRRYGFDEPTGVDIPGESPGIVGQPDNWWGSRLATIGFGQGVSVTPLALARAYAAIANGGLLMRPLVVREVVASDGQIVKRYPPEVVRRVMSPQSAAALLAILRNVVRRGTAKGVVIPGYALAGKTGTAQMVINGSYVIGAYTSSFIGIVPADKPQYVILVKIDRPKGAYYGSIVAAPAFSDLARRVLWREGVMPSYAATAARQWQPLSGDSPFAKDSRRKTRNRP